MHKQQRHTGGGVPPDVRDALVPFGENERRQLERAWHVAERYRAFEPADTEFEEMGTAIWTTIEQTIQHPEPSRRSDRSPLRLVSSRTVRRVALAACIVLLVGVGLLLRQRPLGVTAAPGQITAIDLPDGSQVELNSGSTLHYPRSFAGDVRKVELQGEAYFDVEEAERPFVVETFNATTTVVGTSFNVRARSDAPDPVTRLTVLSGAVRFGARSDAAPSLTVHPGQTSVLAAHETTPSPATETPTDHLLAWRRGKFIMANEPLGTILHEVERRFGVNVETRPSHLRYDSLSVFIENPLGAKDILADICKYRGYEYRTVPGGYELYESGVE